MKETEKLQVIMISKAAKLDMNMAKPILKMLGIGAGGGAIGYGVGNHVGYDKGFGKGTQEGQNSAMRNLIMGLYKTLTDTANRGKGVSIPGLQLDPKMDPRIKLLSSPAPAAAPKPAPAAPAPVKKASQREIFLKAAGLGTMVGRGLVRGAGSLLGRIGRPVAESTAKTLMDPAMHSLIGRGALAAGGAAATGIAGAGAGYTIGNERGNRLGQQKGFNHGQQYGYGLGYNEGGYGALQQAGESLNQTYGGFGGRFNGLIGGAQPGQDAIMQLMQQYQGGGQMPQIQ